jgi:hypothetical protein
MNYTRLKTAMLIRNDLREFKKILKLPNFDPSQNDNEILIKACHFGKNIFIKELLQHPKIKVCEKSINQCLKKGRLETFKLIEDYVAIGNCCYVAIELNSVDIALYLLEKCNDHIHLPSILNIACKQGHLEIVKKLLLRDFLIDIEFILESMSFKSYHVLEYLSKHPKWCHAVAGDMFANNQLKQLKTMLSNPLYLSFPFELYLQERKKFLLWRVRDITMALRTVFPIYLIEEIIRYTRDYSSLTSHEIMNVIIPIAEGKFEN